MPKETKIQWCDSTLNLQSGCDGCELRNLAAGVNRCYAGRIIDKVVRDAPDGVAPKGWPLSFEQPALFLDRLQPALDWKSLAGVERKDKEWINSDLPRMIFLNDMGDTWTESLDAFWLKDAVPKMAESSHVWQFLTKRPKRMFDFFNWYCQQTTERLPWNFWLGTSVTSKASFSRIEQLLTLRSYTHSVLWLSLEPLWEDVSLGIEQYLSQIDWVVIGGESGMAKSGPHGVKPFHHSWAENMIDLCGKYGVPIFIKQMGTLVLRDGWRQQYNDSHGGDWNEWPKDFRVREFPAPDLAYRRHLEGLNAR